MCIVYSTTVQSSRKAMVSVAHVKHDGKIYNCFTAGKFRDHSFYINLAVPKSIYERR